MRVFIGRHMLSAYENTRGRLRREASADLDRLHVGRPESWHELQLCQLEGATEFSDDPLLSDPIAVVRAFRATDAGMTLGELAESTRSSMARELGGRPIGRPRMPGDWPAAYLAYVLSGSPALQPWWAAQQSTGLWEACGFERPPASSEAHLRFGELEEQWSAFATVAQGLIRRARDHDPRIGDVIMVDATQ